MKKHILILGGMGPQASLLLHRRIVNAAAENGAKNGSDFPAITHLSLPIDDFISDQAKLPAAIKMIRQQLRHLWRRRLYSYCYCL